MPNSAGGFRLFGRDWYREARHACAILASIVDGDCDLPKPGICAQALESALERMLNQDECETDNDFIRRMNSEVLDDCINEGFIEEGGLFTCIEPCDEGDDNMCLNLRSDVDSVRSRARATARDMGIEQLYPGDNYHARCTVVADPTALVDEARTTDVLCTGESFAAALLDNTRPAEHVYAWSTLNARRCGGELPPYRCEISRRRLGGIVQRRCDGDEAITSEVIAEVLAGMVECNNGSMWNRGGACAEGDDHCQVRATALTPHHGSALDMPVLRSARRQRQIHQSTAGIVAISVSSTVAAIGLIVAVIAGIAWVERIVRARRALGPAEGREPLTEHYVTVL